MLQSPALSNPNRWLTGLFTLFLAAAAAASAVFWVLQWPKKTPTVLSAVSTQPTALINTQHVARLLGARAEADGPQAPDASAPSPVRLLGVIALGHTRSQGQDGSALLATDGAGAKPYRVGDAVADGWVLQAVKPRSVVLGRPGQTQGHIVLELPLLPGMTDRP